MISVRAATTEEMRGVTEEVLVQTCADKWAFEKDGKLVAFAGVNVPSLTSQDGFPWLHFVDKSLLSNREILKLAKIAMHLWSKKYRSLWAFAEVGDNEKWFQFLGFRVDTSIKPFYDGRKTVVFMRCVNG